MGYDMHWVTKDPVEEIALAEARLQFNEAVAARDKWDRDSENAKLAQKAVDHAYDVMRNVEKSYFRLNVWGMQEYRMHMLSCGMIHEQGIHPPWPEATNFGISDEEEYNISEEDPRYLRLQAARDEVLRWAPEVPGIPIWKFCSNDGWLVTPVECQGAIHAWVEAGKSIPDTTDPDYWMKWIEYLMGATEHGGFRVY